MYYALHKREKKKYQGQKTRKKMFSEKHILYDTGLKPVLIYRYKKRKRRDCR